ncbi:hypothetical protein [Thermoactinospora rubra]|uniref:hypothetical protein n=1 Tax=Thermoactinospora rubra TaxID=1088767 RepID=UPI000A11CF3C|nr:hypothetical protein [Thermoactinospora rubra]
MSSFAELWQSLPACSREAIEASVADAPPFTTDAARTLRRVFAGAGDRIAQRRATRDVHSIRGAA